MLRWLGLSGVIVVLDQATKYVAEAQLVPYRAVEVLPFFDLTLMYNRGAAFSFLSDQDGWQRWFLAAIALGVCVFLVRWLMRLEPAERHCAAGLALVIGGALGNLIDRLLLGEVVDFIHLHYQEWYWPAFNVADSAITVGVVLLLFASLRRSPAPAT